MLRRTLVLLLGMIGMAGCQSSNSGAPIVIQPTPGQLGSGGSGSRDAGQIAILLPMSGRLAEISRPMLRGAQLALLVPGSPVLDIKDTGGTPEGAAQAAQDAIARGARMILGPLTSPETAQVAPIAQRARVPVLAFTNDQGQSQPGVWTLGITPGQQVRRLAAAVRETNRGPICALLPDNDFGKAMGDELTRITAADGQQPPFVRMVGSGNNEITGAVNELAGLAGPDQPLPCGAIMLASTGNDLRVFAKAFADARIDRSKVQILGPALWVDPASGSGAMTGAWFAMPDPDARRDLVRDYVAQYKESPPPRVDLSYDAASIARVLASQGRVGPAGLTQPVGFTGVDGWFALTPDGQVRRGLAVFRVDRLGPTKIFNAPMGLAPPAG
jgi:branched-chain amino acid transport system substrate-binding protein